MDGVTGFDWVQLLSQVPVLAVAFLVWRVITQRQDTEYLRHQADLEAQDNRHAEALRAQDARHQKDKAEQEVRFVAALESQRDGYSNLIEKIERANDVRQQSIIDGLQSIAAAMGKIDHTLEQLAPRRTPSAGIVATGTTGGK